MDENVLRRIHQAHREARPAPSVIGLRAWVDELLELLFPEMAHEGCADFDGFRGRWYANRSRLVRLLESLGDDLDADPAALADDLDAAAEELRTTLLEDADAIFAGDPAAVSHEEVVRTYPGFLAIAVYRIAHFFCLRKVPVIPRVLTEYAHARTGIDIHPAARISERFCIDHGTGIVVGETTEIGRNVKLYQGVTLGALSVDKELARTKRHPTVEDDVVVYAGATILGGETVVGRGSVIGGSVWLLHSVPPHSRVYHDPDTVIEEQTGR